VRVQSTLLFPVQPVVGEGLVGIGTLLDGEAGKEDGELPSSGMVVSPSANDPSAEGCAPLGKLLEPADCVARVLPVIFGFSRVGCFSRANIRTGYWRARV
jgi:hypothetical protein